MSVGVSRRTVSDMALVSRAVQIDGGCRSIVGRVIHRIVHGDSLVQFHGGIHTCTHPTLDNKRRGASIINHEDA